MKIIKVDEVKVGDELIIASGGNLRTLRVVKEPEMSGRYYKNRPYYKSVRCTANIEIEKIPAKKWDWKNKVYVDFFRKVKNWNHTFDEHNERISINMNYKDILLIKRNGIEV